MRRQTLSNVLLVVTVVTTLASAATLAVVAAAAEVQAKNGDDNRFKVCDNPTLIEKEKLPKKCEVSDDKDDGNDGNGGKKN